MPRRQSITLFLIVALLFTAVALNISPAKATTVNSYSVGCSSVTVTFTTDDIDVYELHSHAYVGATEIIGSVDETYHYIALSGAGTYSITIPYSAPQAAGTIINFSEIHLHSSGVDDFAVILAGSYACGGSVADSYVGPAIPAGWEFRWMTCSSPVYDKPGGQPVGNDAVWAGQSFYVNPKPQLDASGKSWSQVFVSSTISPWIPTSCVK